MLLSPHDFFRPLARTAAIVAGWGLIALAILTGVEVLSRKLLNASIQGVDEIGGYVLAITSTIGFTWALLQRTHTRVDVFLVRLPAGVQAFANLAASSVLAIGAVFLAHRGYLVLTETIAYQSHASTPLRTPLIWPQGIWFAGLVLFATTSVVLAGSAVVAIARGRAADFNSTFGPRPMKEEVDEELAVHRAVTSTTSHIEKVQ